LEHPEIDINFCLCWANENWTRAWDGQMRDVLIAQEYSDDDPAKFIDDLAVYFNDKRYIRIDSKPVIIAYNCRAIPEIKTVFAKWRERAREIGIGEIVIWACNTDDSDAKTLGITDVIDGQVEFPPHNCRDDRIAVKPLKTPRRAHLYNYQKLVAMQKGRYENINSTSPVYRCVMSAWDNACRRKDDYTAFYAYSTPAFYEWVRMALKNARENLPEDRRFMFINAWNEWAEGTYMEPDEKYGYATINTFSKALFGYPLNEAATPVLCGAKGDSNLKKAVQIHLYFTEEADNILNNVNLIPKPFDCFISTDTQEKADYIAKKFEACNADKVIVEVFENRGRDVAPFLSQMRERIDNYDLICHIHSKKTTFSGYGDHWREYLYRHLFGSTDNVNGIIEQFERDETLGLVFPENYPLISSQIMFGANRSGCEEIAKKLGIERPLPAKAVFPAGNMFWARTSAVRQMFTSDIFCFDVEKGQVNGTDAHMIERLWVYLAQSNGYGYKKTFNCCDNTPAQKPRGIAIYAHYDKDDILSFEDLELLRQLKQQVEALIFVSTSQLGGMQMAQLDGIADRIVLRENTGFDFTSFKQIICEIGKDNLKNVSRLVLCNNSIYTPYKSLDGMFAKMDGKADFWGVNEFPSVNDGSFLGQKTIPRHLQSYFMVFENNVLASKEFYEFFERLPNINTLEEAILHGESRLTGVLNKAGFSDAAYVAESGIAPQYMNCW
ncbi:MAG: glycoside hydrolase family 99-like domain-containing protein, partial [Clostridia bacterium]|nr:glycoside hydrolase family 99-like domain-containing protein [Clostridia bacterium]